MELLRKLFRKKPKGRKHRCGFWVEDDDVFYDSVNMVGTAMSDWGPLDEPWRKPWEKKKEKPPKPSFGFARVLDDV